MEKELVMACVLISVSLLLKIWSLVALYHLSTAIVEEDFFSTTHHHLLLKKGQQVH